MFFLLLAGNLGLYVPGVLLIREARIRWNAGWGSVLLLGAAYGIVEEGIALSTLFNPHAGVSGVLGEYGHFLGVSWVWLAGVLAVHVVFSISVPIYLLDLALPETRGLPLLGRRGMATAFVVLGLDTAVLLTVVDLGVHFFAGLPLLVGSGAAIAGLVAAARWLPAGALKPRTAEPRRRPLVFALTGLAFFPSVIVLEGVCGAVGAPAAVAFLAVVGLLAAFLYGFLRVIGQRSNEPHLIALAFGLVAPLMMVGLVSQIAVPVVVVADLVAGWFFWHLWRRYSPPEGVPGTHPAGVAS
ncbi:MAG: hypothetical protein L3J81_00300 [Thermoplasmata archaeon]|nr:hypothetical protein [Thermoplasmata archaeon]